MRARLGAPALALLALNAAAFLAYTLPRSLEERSVEQRAAVLESEAARTRGQVAAQRRRTETVRANTRDAERFEREVLKDRSSTLLPAVNAIHAAAQETGVELGTESFGREELRALPVTRVTITMPVTGGYAELLEFLGRLERAREFVVVDQVRLGNREGTGEAELSVGLSVYFRSDPGAKRAG